MRYHVGRLCGLLDGADRKDSDAHQENPQRTSCQDLCHALCIRLEVSLVFIFYFSILICFLTPPSSDLVTLTRAHISDLARAHCHILSDKWPICIQKCICKTIYIQYWAVWTPTLALGRFYLHCLCCLNTWLPLRNLVSASQDGKLIVWDSYSTNKASRGDILFGLRFQNQT